MGIFRTNDPTQFDDIDGIIIDEQTPPSQITGVAANVAILVGQFQRGPEALSLPMASIGEFLEIYGKSSYKGNIQLRNKRFGRIRIIRAAASDAAAASITLDTKLKLDAKYKGAYGNNIKVTVENASNDVIVPAVAAIFDAAVAGVTGNVELTANTAGVAGNSILLTGDGVTTLTALVAAWNLANPSNQVTLNSANGADVPDNLEAIQLAGGAAATQDPDAGVKITIKDTNPNKVLSDEVYDNIKIGDIVASTFAQSALVTATVLDALSGEIATSAEASMTGGTDGTIADLDYETAIEKAEVERAGNVLFLDDYNDTRNQYLKSHAALTQDKMVICCAAEADDRAAAITKAAGLRDSDGRIILAWPWIETTIDGALQFTNPASWTAAIFTQVAPNIALSKTQNTQFLSGVTGLKYETGRNGHIALDEAGVMAFERDSDIGFVIKNAVTTQILNSQKKEILRRRMTDFLTNSIAFALKNWQNDVNSAAKRDEIKAAILDFDTRLVADRVLPSNNEVQGGDAVLVDVESRNTDSVIAQGKFIILYKRRIYSSMRYIVLQAEIGTGVVVTEEQG